MSGKMQIDAALVKLEAGKFSFVMVDAIKDHIYRTEQELKTARSLHASAIHELKQRDYTVWRLEGEIQKLNSKIHALIRANVMTEKADRAAAVALEKMAEYFEISRKFAVKTAQSAAADLKNPDLPAQLLNVKVKIEALRGRLLNVKTAEELAPYAKKLAEGFDVARKNALLMADRLAAYLSSLHKTAA